MTLRTSEQCTPSKSTTISRRLRNRSSQRLATQPPVLQRFKILPTNRAAKLPRNSTIDHQTPESPTHFSDWDTSDCLQNSLNSNLAQPSHTKLSRQYGRLRLLSRDLSTSSQNSISSLEVSSISASVSEFRFQPAQDLSFLPSPLPSVTNSNNIEFQSSVGIGETHHSFLDSQDMSTLGFMMAPSQYGMNHYGSASTSHAPNYPPHHSYAEQRSSTSEPYRSSYASSPALNNDDHSRRQDSHIVLPPYQPQQSAPRSHFQPGQPLGSMRAGPAPSASSSHNYTYSAPPIGLPSPAVGSNSYSSPQSYPSATYGESEYHPLPTMYPPSTVSSAYHSYNSTPGIQSPHGKPGSAQPSASSVQNSAVMPRVLNTRPKPMCWEHGCNGRQFSTFSNLLRHQREKSGTASKSLCPRCGAEFTRTTARNGHMQHDKCKPQRTSGPDR